MLMLIGYLWCARDRHAATIPSWRASLRRVAPRSVGLFNSSTLSPPPGPRGCAGDPEGLGLFSRAKSFMQLGAPGALMMGLEAWSFETTTLLAGLLGTVHAAKEMVPLSGLTCVPSLWSRNQRRWTTPTV